MKIKLTTHEVVSNGNCNMPATTRNNKRKISEEKISER